jgi:hypothetical protein
MTELYRLEAKSDKGRVTLVLSASELVLEPSEELLRNVESTMREAKQQASAIPVIGWFVGKMTDVAGRYMNKMSRAHPLSEVEIQLKHDHIRVKAGQTSFGFSALEVDPTEAYIFEAKFREAQKALVVS